MYGDRDGDGPDRPDRAGQTGQTGRWPWRSTLLLTALVLVGSHVAAHGQTAREPLDPFAGVLLAGGSLLLLWRHRRPALVALGTSVAALLYLAAGYPYGPVLLTFALGCFSAVVAGQRRAAWSAIGLLWAGHLLVAHWLYAYLPPAGDRPTRWTVEVGVAAWALAILAVSELVRVRREQWAKERAERARAAQRRADEERLRIARELHDVLAHSISVINVQAGVGLALLDSDPGQARAALTTIKSASKEALGEVRQVLDTLRAPGDAPRTPTPGLDRLQELVDQAANAGLTVHVDARTAAAEPCVGDGGDPRNEAHIAAGAALGAAGADLGDEPGVTPAPAHAAANGPADDNGPVQACDPPPAAGPAPRPGSGPGQQVDTATDRGSRATTPAHHAPPAPGRRPADRPGPAHRPDRARPGGVPALPPGLDLAAFRIVQEALTNVVRHSGSRHARVQIRYGARTVRLRIDDDGPATAADAGGSGNGLAGMRERAAALGGTIDAGPRPDGGFTVTAELPLKEDR